MPDERPMAYWVGARCSEARSLVAAIAWVAAMRRMAVPIPIGRMLFKLVRSL